MSQRGPLATDRVLGALWLVLIVLLLMVRELYRSSVDPGLGSVWWAVGLTSTVFVVLLAMLAVLRLVGDDRTIAGSVLAALLILYSPIHAGLVVGLFGGVADLLAFNSAVQAIFYPVLTLLALFVLMKNRTPGSAIQPTE